MTTVIQGSPCPSCGQLHDKNKKCPNCGYTLPRVWTKYLIHKSGLLSALFYSNILLFIVSILWTIFSSRPLQYDFFGFFSPDIQVLNAMGMLYLRAVLQGEFYRLVGYMFLHGSLLHLLLNMFWFYYLSKEVKNFLLDSQIFLVYIVSGISGAIVALLFGGGAPVIGSSGAVFGLLGCLLAYGRKRKDLVGFIVWKKYSFLALVMIIFGFLLPGVSNSGHIGGIAGGFGISYLLFSTKVPRIFFLFFYILSTSLLLWGGFSILQNLI